MASDTELHVNDIPLPRQKLQDPVPLAQGVWLGSLRQLDKIVELKSCGVRAIVNMLGPRWQKESLNGMRLQYPEDWGSFRSSGSRHCRSEDPAEPSRPNLQAHAVLPLAEEANFCSLQDGYQQVHDCLCGSLDVSFEVAFATSPHYVVCRRPMSLESVTFQEELIKLAKVNGLLCRVAGLEDMVREVKAPLLHVW